MPRSAREVIPGTPYHVCQRGNNRKRIFSDDEDKIYYLSYLNEKSLKNKMNILAYCLMNNHVHLIVIPEKPDSMSATFCVVNTVFARHYNDKFNRTGHILNGRYYSVMLDENHLAIGARYVEKNPVRAGIVKRAEEWEWSSAKNHLLGEKGLLQLGDLFKYIQLPKTKWKEYLNIKENKKELYFIRKN